jgi:ABC-2 type transport system permease protein
MGRWLRSYGLLMAWSLLRLRAALPALVASQTLIGVGVVVGYGFLIPDIDEVTALYLSTGALTIGLITVGMIAAPQLVAQHKLAGILDHQRAMPVPRLATLAADGTVWLALALPGLAATLGIAALRFDVPLRVSPWVALAVPLVTASSVAIGYGLAHAARPEVTAAVTQALFLVALMFAPISYPEEHLPGWLARAHDYLPFAYMAQAIRETVQVPATGVSPTPFLVLIGWCVAGLAITYRVMNRRA